MEFFELVVQVWTGQPPPFDVFPLLVFVLFEDPFLFLFQVLLLIYQLRLVELGFERLVFGLWKIYFSFKPNGNSSFSRPFCFWTLQNTHQIMIIKTHWHSSFQMSKSESNIGRRLFISSPDLVFFDFTTRGRRSLFLGRHDDRESLMTGVFVQAVYLMMMDKVKCLAQ